MQLKNKVAVIYGAAGAIGSAVSIEFASQGAKVFLTGRNSQKLQKVADAIKAAGGSAEIAELDALNEEAIIKHMNDLIAKEGRIDVSFNAIGIRQAGVQGIPLMEIPIDNFNLPLKTYTMSLLLTARIAAKKMITQKSGVILTLTAIPSRLAAPLVGGMAPAWAAIEALTRTMASEFGSFGIRVVCLRADGMPETDTITEVFGLHAKRAGMSSHKEFQGLMESFTILKRLPKLSEISNAAAYLASDGASAITGTTINVNCGSVVD